MGILGTVGSLYMAVLIMLLVLGFGFLSLWLVDYIIDVTNKSGKNSVKVKGTNVKAK